MKDTTESSSLAQEAYDFIKQRIVRREIALGQVISRRKLAAELGMSFLPVSEALQRLEIEGLLESRPRAGTRVRIPTRQDVRGHFIVREALEVQAALLFAELATPEQRLEIQKLAARVDALFASGDRAAYAAAHEKLHRRIAECTRCRALAEAIEKSHAVASTWFCGNAPESSSLRPHQDLAQALAEHAPGKAADAMREHISVSMQYALDRLKPYFRLRKSYGQTFHRSLKRQKLLSVDPATIN